MTQLLTKTPLAVFALAAALLGVGPIAARPAPAPVAVEAKAPVTILISIDGFRAYYLDRRLTPVMTGLARNGVRAVMRPSFPSKTFPNHWTLVTGVVPDRHGIVGNSFTDPARPDQKFTMDSDEPFWWNAAEPLWVTAEKADIRTATMFWPGANVAWGATENADPKKPAIGGTRPRDWQQYNQNVSDRQRVDAIIDWLRRPATTRPQFLTLYFDEVDEAGHDNGPDSPAVDAAIAQVDAAIGRLVAGLAELDQPANLVIVADHGMAGTSDTRVIPLDTLLDPADYTLVDDGAFATFRAIAGHEAALEGRLLGRHPHMQCWRTAEMPPRFHFGRNVRIPPYFCLADAGWLIKPIPPKAPFTGGTHGYDPADPSMAALFIANGPAFASNKRLDSFDNVAIAPLIRDLIGLPADAALDGSDAPFRGVLRVSSRREGPAGNSDRAKSDGTSAR